RSRSDSLPGYRSTGHLHSCSAVHPVARAGHSGAGNTAAGNGTAPSDAAAAMRRHVAALAPDEPAGSGGIAMTAVAAGRSGVAVGPSTGDVARSAGAPIVIATGLAAPARHVAHCRATGLRAVA